MAGGVLAVLNLPAELQLGPAPFGDAILPYIQEDEWFLEALAQRASAELGRLKRELDDFDVAQDERSRRARKLFREETEILDASGAANQRRALQGLAQRASKLRDELRGALQRFERRVYRPLMGGWSEQNLHDATLGRLCAQLADRFDRVIRPGIEGCQQRLEDVTRRVNKDES